MTKDNIFKKGVRAIKEGRINLLLFGILYYLISLKNKTIEELKYDLIKFIKKGEIYNKIIVNDSSMYVDLKDKGISKELSVHKKRERFSTEFVKKIIKTKDIIIDIGANIGYYALLEARLAKKGKIYAIEPIPKNNKLLNENVKLNKYKNISIFQYAIGDKNEIGIMNISDKCNWSSFTKNPNTKVLEEIKVPLITLDKFIEKNVKKNPSLIRMDVEGYECQILKGMKKMLKEGKPLKIFMELHPYWLGLMSREDMKELINTLKKNNFKIKAIITEVAPYNYKDIKLINWLRKLFKLPKFGIIGKSYEELENLLRNEDIYTPQIFFERK